MRNLHSSVFTILFLFLILLSACSSIDCPVENQVYTVYHIYNRAGEETTLEDTLFVWTPRADGTDTLLIGSATSRKSIQLPISYNNNEDLFVFYICDTLQQVTLDTVWVSKADTPHFESVDCKATYFHEILGVRSTHDGIDTVIINNPHVHYDPSQEHFHIIFKSRY